MRYAPLAFFAVLALAACGGYSAPATAPSPAKAAAAAQAPQTCKQKSDAWKTASAPTLNSFKAAISAFGGGGQAVTSAQASTLVSASRAALATPPPACADPKGYYQLAMAQLVTAGSAAAGGGMLSELGALAPLENAETDITLLDAEIQKTIGASKL